MKLLKQLYSIYSPSGKEDKMREFIKAHCEKLGVSVTEDKGNLYVTKGKADTYPCVVAHMDQVQDHPCIPYQAGELVFGLSADKRSFEGLGADDKNGIWIALKCLESTPEIKLAFFRQEETGCLGSTQADLTFFEDCRFVIQCDRKGGHDFINSISGTRVCGDDFIKAANIKTFGFKTEFGMMTDVWKLRNLGVKVSCCNISCGYYEPHTNKEYTVLPELKNTLAFVKSIIKNCTDVYTFETPKPLYSGNYLGGGYSGGYGGSWYGPSLSDRIDQLEMGVNELEFDIDANTKSIGELLKRVRGLEKILLDKPQKSNKKAGDLPEF